MIGDAVVINKGASASIFATGIPQSGNQAYATKGSKTVQGRWYIKHNPLRHDLPSGYTELTHITSSGTQYIDTNIWNYGITQNLTVKMDFIFSDFLASNESGFFGAKGSSTQSPTFFISNINDTHYLSTWCGSGTGLTPVIPATIGTEFIVEFGYNVGTGRKFIINGVDYSDGSTQNNALNNSSGKFSFFSDGSTPVSYSAIKLKSSSIIIDNDKKIDLVPCINPNNEVGMYDLVSQTFFGNSGTGSFIAGDVVPQYTYGFLISPINELGTWTVHAIRDGVDRTTTVLVDAAEMYEVNTFSRLPSGYTEVEYIQSSGTQYINSGIAQNSNTEIECKYSVYSGTNSIGTIIGNANSGTGSNRFLLLCAYPNAGRTDFAIGDSLYTSVSHTVTLNTPIHVIAKNGYVEVDGLKEYPTSTPFSTVISNMYLFAQHWNDIAELLSKIRIHYLTISNSGTLQRNFIPCHNSSNVIGMYDLVSNTFFTNAGTGVFVAGPEVVA